MVDQQFGFTANNTMAAQSSLKTKLNQLEVSQLINDSQLLYLGYG